MKDTPAVGWTFPLGAILAERDSATQLLPRSIAAQLPAAKMIEPAARAGTENATTTAAVKGGNDFT